MCARRAGGRCYGQVRTLESEFEDELNGIQRAFEDERTFLVNLHAREKKELNDIMEHIDNQFKVLTRTPTPHTHTTPRTRTRRRRSRTRSKSLSRSARR
jgi:hypothetical protein